MARPDETIWPTMTEVEAARGDATRLLAWSRSLPAADSSERHSLLGRIVQYLPQAVRSTRVR
jgi:hypothetical protein